MALRTVGHLMGYTLLGVTPARWPLRAGCDPVVEGFTMAAGHADAFMAQHAGSPVTLTLGSNENTATIQNLYAIRVLPGDDYAHKRVMLADRRIWWDRRRIVKGYNIHRIVGTKRTDATGTEEIDPTVPDIQYARWSLKNPDAGAGGVWSSTDVLLDVLREVQQIEDEWQRVSMDFFVKDEATNNALPVDQLYLRDKAGDAMRRVLAFFPGADLYIATSGEVVVFNRNSGAERLLLDDVGPPMWGRGFSSFVDWKYLAPAKVRVYFTIEAEVRHNIVESGSVEDTIAGLGDGRTLTNVVQVPDLTIQLTPRGGGAKYEVAQFTYADFHQYLIALNEELRDAPFDDLERIDYRLLQEAFVPGVGLWNAFRVNGELNPSADWTARAGALEDCYRKLFMINPRWTDRSLSIKASSLLTIDRALGQRGPARVYSDYAIIPSMRGTVKAWTATEKIPFCTNVKGYPLSGIINATVHPARCEVQMEHEDQGVFRLVFKRDRYGFADEVLPSMVEVIVGGESLGLDSNGLPLAPGPDANLALTPDVISFDSSSDENTVCKLVGSDKKAVILTHVPAAPNSKDQLFEILVDPPDVAAMLPAALSAGIRGARGPILDVEIGSTLETARIPWQDTNEHATIVEGLFGFRGKPPPSDGIRDRVQNYGGSNNRTGASILAIALAAAARTYSKFADRYVGSRAGALNPGLTPEGRVGEVVHEISPQGEGITTLFTGEDMPDIDFRAFLPDAARAILDRRPGIDGKRGS